LTIWFSASPWCAAVHTTCDQAASVRPPSTAAILLGLQLCGQFVDPAWLAHRLITVASQSNGTPWLTSPFTAIIAAATNEPAVLPAPSAWTSVTGKFGLNTPARAGSARPHTPRTVPIAALDSFTPCSFAEDRRDAIRSGMRTGRDAHLHSMCG